MAWSAHRIYLEPKEPVLGFLSRFPPLLKGLYDVPSLEEGLPPGNKVPAHPFPGDGLFVVRELCGRESGLAASYGLDAVFWDDLRTFGEVEVIEPGPSFPEGDYPPGGFLAFLKALSLKTGALTSFYGAQTWGGDMEYEYAWVFGERDLVYAADIDATRVPGSRRKGVLQFEPGGSRVLRRTLGETVVQHMMAHFGVRLPGPYFELHTRTFDWGPYKVEA